MLDKQTGKDHADALARMKALQAQLLADNQTKLAAVQNEMAAKVAAAEADAETRIKAVEEACAQKLQALATSQKAAKDAELAAQTTAAAEQRRQLAAAAAVNASQVWRSLASLFLKKNSVSLVVLFVHGSLQAETLKKSGAENSKLKTELDELAAELRSKTATVEALVCLARR
jgi:hypothetical protein